jgi:hypothetical protein
MNQKLIFPLIFVGFGVACGGGDEARRGDQKAFETVQEGSAAGVTSTIAGPGEALPPITGTNADTTTAFTIDPNVAAATPGAVTQGSGTLAGTLPPPSSGTPMMGTNPYPRSSPPPMTSSTPARNYPAPTQPQPQQPRQRETEPVQQQPPLTDTSATTTSGTAQPQPPPATNTNPPAENKPPVEAEDSEEEEEPPPPTTTDTRGQ